MQEGKTHNGKICFMLAMIGIAAILSISMYVADNLLMSLSFALMMLSMVPFYIKFEKKELNAEEMVLIAMISALAAVGRVPFPALPSIQPTSFIIIMAALAFGKEVGFLVGNTAALISNLFLGQGPWTPWQMVSWGMMGFTAGWLKDGNFIKSKSQLCCFGFVWGFLFGWMMNLWALLFFQLSDISWKLILGSCITSFKFDLNHALCNVVFILLFNDRFTKILNRTKEKYGLLK
jgi:energy-coupling factor transport system substrate-specific component